MLPTTDSQLMPTIALDREMGVEQMSPGRTALAPKAQIGGRAQPIYGYLRHRNPALNLTLPSILALLPTPDELPERHPFKSTVSKSS